VIRQGLNGLSQLAKKCADFNTKFKKMGNMEGYGALPQTPPQPPLRTALIVCVVYRVCIGVTYAQCWSGSHGNVHST